MADKKGINQKAQATEKVINTKIDNLIPDDKNANKGTQYGQHLLEKSLRELGFGRSILLDKDNRVIAGNKTLQSASDIGLENVRIIETDGNEIIAIRRKDVSLDSKKGRELAIADNVTNEVNLCWDDDNLKELSSDFEINLNDWGLNFDNEDEKAKEEEKNVKDEEVKEREIEQRVKKNEIWQLGKHRLMCTDCTDKENIAKLMNGQKADLCFTSPPYNVSAKSHFGSIDDKKYMSGNGAYEDYKDNLNADDYTKLLTNSLNIALEYCTDVLFNIGYCAGALQGTAKFLGENAKYFGGVITWRKNICFMPFWDSQYGILGNITEPIYFFNKKGIRKFSFPQWNKKECKYNIFEVGVNSTNEYADVNCATFPVELASEVIKSFTKESIIDLFGGTGTTLIAAEQLNRQCFMTELSPKSCDVIIARWEKLTGEKAKKIF